MSTGIRRWTAIAWLALAPVYPAVADDSTPALPPATVPADASTAATPGDSVTASTDDLSSPGKLRPLDAVQTAFEPFRRCLEGNAEPPPTRPQATALKDAILSQLPLLSSDELQDVSKLVEVSVRAGMKSSFRSFGSGEDPKELRSVALLALKHVQLMTARQSGAAATAANASRLAPRSDADIIQQIGILQQQAATQRQLQETEEKSREQARIIENQKLALAASQAEEDRAVRELAARQAEDHAKFIVSGNAAALTSQDHEQLTQELRTDIDELKQTFELAQQKNRGSPTAKHELDFRSAQLNLRTAEIRLKELEREELIRQPIIGNLRVDNFLKLGEAIIRVGGQEAPLTPRPPPQGVSLYSSVGGPPTPHLLENVQFPIEVTLIVRQSTGATGEVTKRCEGPGTLNVVDGDTIRRCRRVGGILPRFPSIGQVVDELQYLDFAPNSGDELNQEQQERQKQVDALDEVVRELKEGQRLFRSQVAAARSKLSAEAGQTTRADPDSTGVPRSDSTVPDGPTVSPASETPPPAVRDNSSSEPTAVAPESPDECTAPAAGETNCDETGETGPDSTDLGAADLGANSAIYVDIYQPPPTGSLNDEELTDWNYQVGDTFFEGSRESEILTKVAGTAAWCGDRCALAAKRLSQSDRLEEAERETQRAAFFYRMAANAAAELARQPAPPMPQEDDNEDKAAFESYKDDLRTAQTVLSALASEANIHVAKAPSILDLNTLVASLGKHDPYTMAGIAPDDVEARFNLALPEGYPDLQKARELFLQGYAGFFQPAPQLHDALTLFIQADQYDRYTQPIYEYYLGLTLYRLGRVTEAEAAVRRGALLESLARLQHRQYMGLEHFGLERIQGPLRQWFDSARTSSAYDGIAADLARRTQP